MRFTIAFIFLFLFFHSTPAPSRNVSAPDSPFDTYGELSWEDEKARLDNFAIQLQQAPDFIGYVFVYDATSGCHGEAQARAIRAKRYVVEYRGVPWNRVIWRQEGYQSDIHTRLQIAQRNLILPRPLIGPTWVAFSDRRANRACRERIRRIRRSKW